MWCDACCVYPLRGILMSLSSLLNCFVGLMCLMMREVCRKLISSRVSVGDDSTWNTYNLVANVMRHHLTIHGPTTAARPITHSHARRSKSEVYNLDIKGASLVAYHSLISIPASIHNNTYNFPQKPHKKQQRRDLIGRSTGNREKHG